MMKMLTLVSSALMLVAVVLLTSPSDGRAQPGEVLEALNSSFSVLDDCIQVIL